MPARPVLFASLLVAGVAAFADPASPSVTTRYKVTAINHQVVDLSAFSQPEQVTHVVTSLWVAVTSTDSAGGRALKLVIDSVHADSIDSPQPIPPEMFDSLRGVTATGWVDAHGNYQNLGSPTARGAQAGGLLRSMFPRMNPRAKNGDKWTDTVETGGEYEGLTAGSTVRRVTNWAVNGEQTVAGVKARKIDAAYSQSISGEMAGPMGQMAIDGTGTGTATYLIGPDGRQLGANSNTTITMSITIPQAPEPIPVTATSTSVITLLR
jgi:hypothetical protein